MRRVLVTGSRNWPDRNGQPGWTTVWEALTEQMNIGQDMVVVHGDCPTGADAVANQWAQSVCCWYDGPLCQSSAVRSGWSRTRWDEYVTYLKLHDEEAILADRPCAMVHNEPHPADWAKHGRAAGPLRNQAMVDLGADICLAFPLGDSRGTRDCMRRAEAAGIPVRVFEVPS